MCTVLTFLNFSVAQGLLSHILKFRCPYLNLFRAFVWNATPPTSGPDDGGFPFPSPPKERAIQSLAFNFTREHVEPAPDSESEWYHRIFSAIPTRRCLANSNLPDQTQPPPAKRFSNIPCHYLCFMSSP